MPNSDGNEAMLRKAQQLMEAGEFPEEVSLPMLWAGLLAQNGVMGKLDIRLRSVESVYRLLRIGGPILLLLLGAIATAMVKHMTGG